MLAVVAPIAPALPLLGELLILVIALGICYAIVYFCKAVFGLAGGTLGKLPVIGGWINSGIHSVEKKVVGVMSGAITSVEGAVGSSWHQLARLVDWMGREIRSHSNLLYTMAAVMLGQEWAAAIRYAIHRNIAAINGLLKAVNVQVARIARAEERLRHGIGADVLPRIRGAEDALRRVIGKDLAGIRARERALERGAADTWKWIRAHPQALASGAFAGAVAWALARLGATWIRCSRANRLGKSICGMDDSLLESLLADALIVAGSLSLVAFAEEMQDVTEAAVRPIARFWRAD